MGAPDIGGLSAGGIDSDSIGLVSGDLDDISGNIWGDTWSIQSGATYGSASVNPTTGVWSYDLDENNAAVQALDTGQTLTDTFVVRLQDTGGSDTQTVTITITGVPCFVAGTLIETAIGPKPVEAIRPGDLIVTRDDALQQVRWVGQRTVHADALAAEDRLRPIRIRRGALGGGLPQNDLLVSRQHRLLVTGERVLQVCGTDEALLPALRFLDWPGVDMVPPDGPVSYHHLLFDRHQVIIAEGTATESLLLAEEARNRLPLRALTEIDSLFPGPDARRILANPARPIPAPQLQKRIVEHGPKDDSFDAPDNTPAPRLKRQIS
ncbi:MAG: Hint domain-containing protein [Pseudomonadota bacterium]|uniref:Hint domain-containing protein n=1 Tax=Roseovarius TaxID=74030 RepID=UPI0022A6C1F7|nr:Hint domain-containing protein [Roseovarius sp. EGI FJ00037]MCZ0811154.1 Hint domain-containing protein [Roseovarius sp. EGI FJ00037]